jgi:hypothetical protein
MIFKLKQNLTTLAIFSCAASIGCGSTSSKTTESANAKPAATIETKINESANKGNVTVETATGNKTTIEGKDGKPPTVIYDNSTKSTAASSADKIGVAECDEYIEKYEACVTGKVPEAARAAMLASIGQMRQSWKQVAANPQAKASLAGGCKQAQEAAKQTMSAYACAW